MKRWALRICVFLLLGAIVNVAVAWLAAQRVDENNAPMALAIRGLKVYMPAKDFELSKRFYTALGFTMTEGWGGTADFELNGHRFRLQNYYVKDWAENWMAVIDVDDVKAWHERVQIMARSGEFGRMDVPEPHEVDGSMVLEVPDPSGVLLVFVQ